MSDNFCIYKVSKEKPCYIIVLEIDGISRQWLVRMREDLDFRKDRRIAFEIDNDRTGGNDSDPEFALNSIMEKDRQLMDKGKLSVLNVNKNKLEFGIPGHAGSLISGSFVLMVPSWGRNRYRKTWVLIPTGKESGNHCPNIKEG